MSCIILLAEDEVVVRNIVRLLLQRDGHEVLVATDGYEALKLSREYNGQIDLLLTDIGMPRMDGLALVEQIVKDRPGIKILLMSGNPVGCELGELPLLRKPFANDVFRNKVRELLDPPCIHGAS